MTRFTDIEPLLRLNLDSCFLSRAEAGDAVKAPRGSEVTFLRMDSAQDQPLALSAVRSLGAANGREEEAGAGEGAESATTKKR